MSYTAIKNGLATIVKGQGFIESKSVETFEGMSPREFDRRFILKAVSGELDEESQETLCDRFYDTQLWEIHLAVSKSENNDVAQRDNLLRDKDVIIQKVDDPDGWRDYVRMQKYFTWDVTEEPSYFLLIIQVKIQDVITY